MKKIIVTGCNGQLGRAIGQLYADKTEYELVNTDVCDGEGITKLDITNVDQVLSFAREVKPYAIFNCAAFTNVDGCETNEEVACRINAIGPRNLSIAATETGAKFIHISTDYVFPGTSERPLTEFDQPAPISAYGRTKYAGEQMVQQFADRFFILRTAWLYGDGKNFVKTMLGLSEKMDTLNVVCDQFGNPTAATELAKAMAFLADTDNYGIFHATCEGSCSWADFTDEIMRLAGKNVTVNHITSKQYKEMFPQSADRPHYSMLDNYMFRLTSDFRFADWHDAIASYLKELNK